ncbi:MAG: PTS system mannose/fructose/sorbose family transporter subunit IID [Deltaproteobacteria bacterium]|jgi:mannose/fructose/N-acetylgalactosamine-specific phosphotransferase system component IID|nr:PTS system mannose/fructose/sorbose family transporter subunit IID [Deltaproteobacteria bacterium]
MTSQTTSDKVIPSNEAQAGDAPENGSVGRLDKFTLFRTATRLLWLSALWCPKTQQGLGLLLVVEPALTKLHGHDPKALNEARKRFSAFFNTNPVIGGLVVGAILRMEEERIADSVSPQDNEGVVRALASVMAGVGDNIFWKSWLPICCLFAIYCRLVTGALWPPVVIPALFGGTAWFVRFWGIYKGYSLGINTYKIYKIMHGEKLSLYLEYLWMILLAFSTAVTAKTIFQPLEVLPRKLLWILLSIIILIIYKHLCFGRKFIVCGLLYASLIILFLVIAILV